MYGIDLRAFLDTGRFSPLARMTWRRLFSLPAMLLALVTVVFLALQWVPGEPLHELGAAGVDREGLEQLRRVFGEDRPLLERYTSWLAGLLRGDLGVSTLYRAPVTGLLGRALLHTLPLAALAFALQFVLGGVAGAAAAMRPGGRLDRTVVATGGALYAMPTFVAAVALLGLFATGLQWLPVSQMRSIDYIDLPLWGRVWDRLRHLILPALSLALPGAGGVALYLREELRAIQRRPFVVVARAQGLAPRQVIRIHALRNALVPLAQLAGLSLPAVIGGSVVVETLFAWPGMGRLAYEAVLARDRALVLGATVVAGLAVTGGSLLADLLAAWADPRARDAS